MVTHYSSPGSSASQSARRGYVNPFFCVSDIGRESSWNSTQIAEDHRKPLGLSEQRIEVRVTGSFLTIQFLNAPMVLIFSLVLRAVNVPSIKKYFFLKRKLFVTLSNPETTANTANVAVERHMANWNQNLDPL
jgi:hypothetical protein